ncbi:MAG: 7,8-didemethyl-8-hydroxy-5-deazariboflavin synthase subunit CofG [Methanomicrobiaceae archaeon]|nr:7,8-didemethyl-8-hydroxy-5-deazariboflavin synthase subunit CofG [Methanomicrobiaceae archaeon]
MQPGEITYSRNVFLPLTNVCRNRCGYCIFRTPVGEDCIMPPSEVKNIIRAGVMAGCTEALFTFGEKPEEEKGFPEHIKKTGYSSILDYCHAMCEYSILSGILPHTNAGILDYNELERLREVNASMGLMLETTADIPAHRNCPGKKPEVRIETMENAGKLKIPFTTGILVGIGETAEDRKESFQVIADLHRRYGHIQEVIVQNFCPKDGTDMKDYPTVGRNEFCSAISSARETLPDDISVQIPPNLADASYFIGCGVDDLGGVSPVTIDYVNPEHPWPEIDELKSVAGGKRLRERLCIYQRYIDRGWYPDSLKCIIEKLNDDIRKRNEQQ